MIQAVVQIISRMTETLQIRQFPRKTWRQKHVFRGFLFPCRLLLDFFLSMLKDILHLHPARLEIKRQPSALYIEFCDRYGNPGIRVNRYRKVRKKYRDFSRAGIF